MIPLSTVSSDDKSYYVGSLQSYQSTEEEASGFGQVNNENQCQNRVQNVLEHIENACKAQVLLLRNNPELARHHLVGQICWSGLIEVAKKPENYPYEFTKGQFVIFRQMCDGILKIGRIEQACGYHRDYNFHDIQSQGYLVETTLGAPFELIGAHRLYSVPQEVLFNMPKGNNDRWQIQDFMIKLNSLKDPMKSFEALIPAPKYQQIPLNTFVVIQAEHGSFSYGIIKNDFGYINNEKNDRYYEVISEAKSVQLLTTRLCNTSSIFLLANESLQDVLKDDLDSTQIVQQLDYERFDLSLLNLQEESNIEDMEEESSDDISLFEGIMDIETDDRQ